MSDFELKPATIHFLVPDDDGPIKSKQRRRRLSDVHGEMPGGRFSVACDPEAALPDHATGEPGPVTCEACKATPEWKKADAAVSKPKGLRKADPDDFPKGSRHLSRPSDNNKPTPNTPNKDSK